MTKWGVAVAAFPMVVVLMTGCASAGPGAAAGGSPASTVAGGVAGVCSAMSSVTDEVGRIKSSSAQPADLLAAYKQALAVAPDELRPDLQQLIDFAPLDQQLRTGGQPDLSSLSTMNVNAFAGAATSGVRVNQWLGSHCH